MGRVRDSAFASGTSIGVLAYGSLTHVRDLDSGSNNLTDHALWTKKGATLTEQSGNGCSGNVGTNAYNVGGGSTIYAARGSSTITGDSQLAGGSGGMVYD